MKEAAVRLVPVTDREKGVLWNLLQKYLFEMSGCYDSILGTDGNYPYPRFDAYFDGAHPERLAVLFYQGEELAGFAMVNSHSFTGEPVDHSLAEFGVFPKYRRRGVATAAFSQLVESHPGKWQLKYSPDNRPGLAFWNKATAPYGGTHHPFGDEVVVSFTI